MYKLSVIIPVYKVEKYIKQCAESLFNQSLKEIQYIFVDDCSPDNSMEILQEIIKSYPERCQDIVILKNISNCGQAAVRNIALQKSQGEYVIHCDSDDWINPDAYLKMYNIGKTENADIIVCNMIYEYGTHTYIPSFRSFSNAEQTLRACLSGLLHNGVCNKMIRRSLYMDYGIRWNDGYDMLEDTFATTRLVFYASKISFINRPYYHYLQSNPYSITNVSKKWSKKNFDAIIKNTDSLVDFFTNQNKFKLHKEIMQLMMSSKNMLLFMADKKQRKYYHHLYSDCTVASVISHPKLSLRRKLSLILSNWGLYKLSDIIIDLKYCNSKL